MSICIGDDPMQVQGPGGNTSYKNSEYMWVKASGKQLRNALREEIFAQIKLSNGAVFSENQKLRPSIEAPLHQAIDKAFVIHTHSTSAIAAGLSKSLSNTLVAHPEIAIIPYRRPGEDLTVCIKEMINTSKHHSAILQNHGLLVWGNTCEETSARLKSLNSVTNKFLTSDLKIILEAKAKLEDPLNEIFLTPDHAVFNDEMSMSRAPNQSDKNTWLQQMLEQLSIALGSVLHEEAVKTLDKGEVEELRNWEAEKFRKSQNE